jgi:Holliday junction resolvase RusA-like endonuclease
VSGVIVIDVLGTPAPKGSSRAFINKKTGAAIVAPSGSQTNKDKLANWNSAVRAAAAEFVGDIEAPPFVKVPISVFIMFRMARLPSHWGSGKNAGRLKPSAPKYPSGKPDIDKLARTTLDALTGIVFDDDSRIAKLKLDKVYAAPGEEGACITVEAL